MEKSLNYHDLAENDYEFLSYDYEHDSLIAPETLLY